MPTPETSITVESCLAELRKVFPKATWITCRSMARFYDKNQAIGRYAEIELGEDKYIAETLDECLSQIPKRKESQPK